MKRQGFNRFSILLSVMLSVSLGSPLKATAGKFSRNYQGFKATIECFPAISGSDVGFILYGLTGNSVNFFARELNFSYNTGFPSVRVGPAFGSNNTYIEEIHTTSRKSSVSVSGSVNAVSSDIRYLYLFVVPANTLTTTC